MSGGVVVVLGDVAVFSLGIGFHHRPLGDVTHLTLCLASLRKSKTNASYACESTRVCIDLLSTMCSGNPLGQ